MKYMRFIHPSHLLAVRTSDARDQDAGVFGLVILGVTLLMCTKTSFDIQCIFNQLFHDICLTNAFCLH